MCKNIFAPIFSYNNDVCSEYNEFLEDLEEDPALRQNVNIFKDSTKQLAVDCHDQIDATLPHITLEEMLDDLVIDDVEMNENE